MEEIRRRQATHTAKLESQASSGENQAGHVLTCGIQGRTWEPVKCLTIGELLNKDSVWLHKDEGVQHSYTILGTLRIGSRGLSSSVTA